MRPLDRFGASLLGRLDPETGHDLAIRIIGLGLVPMPGPHTTPRLRTTFAGLDLPNPIGLAAGFDKNARAVDPLLKAGFGFIEVGAATPEPQPGNARPRLFRLRRDQGVINRMGFNSDGAQSVAERLAARSSCGVVGLNLGANAHSTDMTADLARVLAVCGPHVDFATLNVSSPNTMNLRDLQERRALARVIDRVAAARAGLRKHVSLFLKVSPDLDENALRGIVGAVRRSGIDAVIATNTTTDRSSVGDAHASEAGGLSGKPLFRRSTRVLSRLYRGFGGDVPLIGAGGIASAEDAYEKIRAGAGALQLYTALVFQGFSVVKDIAAGLDRLLERDGYASVADAVGSAHG